MNIVCWRSSLRIRSKSDALELYGCVRGDGILLIPTEGNVLIRIESGNRISRITSDDIKSGVAVFVPSMLDPYGAILYKWRKYVNAFLGGDE